VHGLTRNGRDFDALALRLSEQYRVICPDIVGRGDSEWLHDGALYTYAQYVADMTALIARADVDAVDWLGTSMGGLIGMILAAQTDTPVRRLVLNDVGPFVPQAALERLASYVGICTRFDSFVDAERYLREVHAPFGALTDTQWRALAERSVSGSAETGYAARYDPEIGTALRAGLAGDVDLWATWDLITCPVLVLRGSQSDLLLSQTAAEMTVRGPRAEVVEIKGCGHAPALLDEAQMNVVAEWLDGRDAERRRPRAVG
jgi:pimeloyl-ACP methyl ester carboxylesterase